MKNIYKIWFILLFCGVSNWLSAQDNRRYLMVVLGNDDTNNTGIESINQLKSLGGNAALITVLWSTVNNWKKDAPNPWQQYDDQIATARRNGMKIAIRIWIDNQRPSVPSDPYNNMEDGFNGWEAGDRMQGFNIFGQNLKVYQQFGGIVNGVGTFRVFTSFAAPATVEKGTTFAARVAQRYSYLLASNELLFVTVGTTGQGEFGYPFVTTKGTDSDNSRLFDYSDPMIKGYQAWLKSKYSGAINKLKNAWGAEAQNIGAFENIRPKYPNGKFQGAFSGPSGLDWYRYRHSVMKTFMYEVTATIKSVDNRYKVVQEYGSVFDDLSLQRGSFSFKDTGESLDGLKINNGQVYDHRFSTDLARTNSPGKWVVNEVEGNANRQAGTFSQDLLRQQFVECFDHGAQVVTLFNFDFTYAPDRAVLSEVAARYIVDQRPIVITPKQTVTYTTSRLLTDGGCRTDRSNYLTDCQAYRDWRAAFDQSGGTPVNLVLQDDILTLSPSDIPRYNRVLVLGNAMTENAPNPAIGWTGGPWGMAATSRANDYVSLLTEKLLVQNPAVSVQRLRLDDWERTYATKTFPYKTAVTDKVAALWAGNKPDLVLFSLSENISQANFDPVTFRDEVLKLIVSTGFTNGVVVLRNSFLTGNIQSNLVLKRIADETGWQFVNLACVRYDPNLTAAADWLAADSLVKRYPGNAGMAAIANLYCAQVPGLNCYGRQGPVSVVSKARIYFGADSCQVCSDRCRGGLLQGSQDSTAWTTLAIMRQPARGWNEVVVNADHPWRYVRFVAAKGCFGELSELEFYSGTRKLKGISFGSGSNYTAALDENLSTVWKATTPGPQNTVGYDFGDDTVPDNQLVDWCPDEVQGLGQLEMAPNPADEYITYLYLMPTTEAVTIEVYDLAGRLMSRQQLAGSEIRQQYRQYVGGWQPGMYIAKVSAGTYSASKRFLIAR